MGHELLESDLPTSRRGALHQRGHPVQSIATPAYLPRTFTPVFIVTFLAAKLLIEMIVPDKAKRPAAHSASFHGEFLSNATEDFIGTSLPDRAVETQRWAAEGRDRLRSVRCGYNGR